jgi:hypothetical protein
MTCATCAYYSAHGCVLGLTQPCTRYTPGVEALEAWLRCDCGGTCFPAPSHFGGFVGLCMTCARLGPRCPDPVAALVAFHEGREG